MKDREKKKEYDKLRYQQKKDLRLKQIREYYENNKESVSQTRKVYYQKNKEHLNQTNHKRSLERMKVDPDFKMKKRLRSIISRVFWKGGYKKGSKTFEILGCDYETFKEHLERQFEPWMTWENYGNPKDELYEPNKTWDIDHIEPLREGETKDDVIRLNHYTNLRPLCSYVNRFIKR